MNKFYFFISSVDNDEVKSLNIFTTSAKKAYSYACKYFAKYKCKGEPQLLAI